MERHLDDELKNYKLKLLKMTTLVEEAIHQSIEALRTRNKYLAESVIKRDNEIDEMENQVEEQAIELLALFQPMAGDLRFITTGMHVNTQLERIGDLTDNICHGVIALADQPLPKSLSDISKLSDQAKFMVTKALDALARTVAGLSAAFCVVVLLEKATKASALVFLAMTKFSSHHFLATTKAASLRTCASDSFSK